MNEKYFFCYSYKLKTFLKEKGILYEFTGNNTNSNKPYWVYLRNEELGNYLGEWSRKYISS